MFWFRNQFLFLKDFLNIIDSGKWSINNDAYINFQVGSMQARKGKEKKKWKNMMRQTQTEYSTYRKSALQQRVSWAVLVIIRLFSLSHPYAAARYLPYPHGIDVLLSISHARTVRVFVRWIWCASGIKREIRAEKISSLSKGRIWNRELLLLNADNAYTGALYDIMFRELRYRKLSWAFFFFLRMVVARQFN